MSSAPRMANASARPNWRPATAPRSRSAGVRRRDAVDGGGGAAERDERAGEREQEERDDDDRLDRVGRDAGPEAAVTRVEQDEAADEERGLPLRDAGDERERARDAGQFGGEEDEHVERAHEEDEGVHRGPVAGVGVLGQRVAFGDEFPDSRAEAGVDEHRDSLADRVADDGRDTEARARFGGRKQHPDAHDGRDERRRRPPASRGVAGADEVLDGADAAAGEPHAEAGKRDERRDG